MFTLSACGQIVVTETDKFQANTVIPEAGGEVVLRQPVAPGLGVKSRLERRKSSVFSSDSAKRKWRLFERKVSVWLSLHVCPSICLDFIFHQCLVQYLPVSVSVTPYVIVHPKCP